MSEISEQDRDTYWMRQALMRAESAEEQQEVPVGAVIVQGDELLSEGWNRPIRSHDPTSHAEIVAIRAAAETLHNYRLLDTTLYVTLEPCAMCVGAIMHARIKRLVFGAYDKRAGAIVTATRLLDEPCFNHKLSFVSGVLEHDCAKILQDFFRLRR